MKTCSKCKETKALTEFGKHSDNKDGLQYYCKACRISISAASYQKISEADRRKRNKTIKEWKTKNKERVKEYRSFWFQNNKGRVNSWAKKRSLARLQRTPKWLTKEQLKEIEDFYVMAQELETVFPWKQHVDHIVPLRGQTVSGFHVPWNLQILSAKANMEKGNKYDG